MIKISLVDDDPEDRASLISLVQEIFQNKILLFHMPNLKVQKIFLPHMNQGFTIFAFLIFL